MNRDFDSACVHAGYGGKATGDVLRESEANSDWEVIVQFITVM
jgi:hypothetical protein